MRGPDVLKAMQGMYSGHHAAPIGVARTEGCDVTQKETSTLVCSLVTREGSMRLLAAAQSEPAIKADTDFGVTVTVLFTEGARIYCCALFVERAYDAVVQCWHVSGHEDGIAKWELSERVFHLIILHNPVQDQRIQSCVSILSSSACGTGKDATEVLPPFITPCR